MNTSFSPEKILDKYTGILQQTDTLRVSGRVTQVVGLVIESEGPQAPIGEVCTLIDRTGRELCKSEIVGFRGPKILSMVLGELRDIAPGTRIIASGHTLKVPMSNGLLGRILDGLGNPIDGKGSIPVEEKRSIYAQPPNPLLRKRIREVLPTGIRAIDGLLTLGKGQRVGIFAGSGVGKSTTLGMIARNTAADVNVIALVGERGRELKEFIEKDLGEEGLARSVVVVATSDQPALVRIKAGLVATTIAEYFRDQGLDVMLMLDSVTRLAMAQREVGLAVGEPPTTKGYTPSVFALMPKLMERAGTSEEGTITGMYTVLVEGDDMNEPIADTARGILDGHIVLSRRLAARGHYPAVEVLDSISRLVSDITMPDQKRSAADIREMLATYREAEDLISVGAYQKRSNPKIDRALALIDRINGFLRQRVDESSTFHECVNYMHVLSSSQ